MERPITGPPGWLFGLLILVVALLLAACGPLAPTPLARPTMRPWPTAIIWVIPSPVSPVATPPLVPSPPLLPTDDLTAQMKIHAHLVTELLNATQGDADAFLKQIVAWSSSEALSETHPASTWVRVVDLDDDGAPEWLVSVPRLEERCDSSGCTRFIRCEVGLCPGFVLLFERDRFFKLGHFFQRKDSAGWLDHPQVLTIDDLNGDGKTDLVLSENWCGAHTCGTRLLLGYWDGQRWHDLAAGRIEQTYTEITIVDQDGDGAKEIVMHGGIVGSAGAGEQRQRTEVYAWRDGGYRLIAQIPDPAPHIYFRMLDANTALVNGDLDRALELAMAAVEEPDRGVGSPSWVQSRVVSYAAIEAMLVYAVRHEPEAMQALLHEIETKYNILDNPYVQAARNLWSTYQTTQDAVAACKAVEQTVAAHLEQAQFFDWYGYAMERLPLSRICPLDGDVKDGIQL